MSINMKWWCWKKLLDSLVHCVWEINRSLITLTYQGLKIEIWRVEIQMWTCSDTVALCTCLPHPSPDLAHTVYFAWISLSFQFFLGTKISFVRYSCKVHAIRASISILNFTFSRLCRKQPKSFSLSFKILFFKLLNRFLILK